MAHFKRHQTAVLCIVLLVIPFFFLNSNLKDPSRLTTLDRTILAISSPIQRISGSIAEAVIDVVSKYLSLVRVSDEKEKLLFENDRLREENQRLRLLWEENRRLQKMLGFRDSFMGTLVPARVIARDVSEYYRIVKISLDAGNDLVEKGMPVVTFDGLVGQIYRVFGDYSEVLLAVDIKSAVDIVVKRNNAGGILRGTGEIDRYECEIEYLLRRDEVRTGDLLLTSGLAAKFPYGILAGRILKIDKQSHGLYQKVKVEPAVDFSRLREVFIITGTEKNIMKKQNAQEK